MGAAQDILAKVHDTEELDVDGVKVTLKRPSWDEVVALRMAYNVEVGPQEAMDVSTASLILARYAVQQCMEGVDDEQTARKLVLATGGDMGQLSQKCLQMCGFVASALNIRDFDQDVPTS